MPLLPSLTKPTRSPREAHLTLWSSMAAAAWLCPPQRCSKAIKFLILRTTSFKRIWIHSIRDNAPSNTTRIPSLLPSRARTSTSTTRISFPPEAPKKSEWIQMVTPTWPTAAEKKRTTASKATRITQSPTSPAAKPRRSLSSWLGNPVPTITDYPICKSKRHKSQIKIKKPLTQIMSNPKELILRMSRSKFLPLATRAAALAQPPLRVTGSSLSEAPKTTSSRSTSSTTTCTMAPRGRKTELDPLQIINNSKMRIKSKGGTRTMWTPMKSCSRHRLTMWMIAWSMPAMDPTRPTILLNTQEDQDTRNNRVSRTW